MATYYSTIPSDVSAKLVFDAVSAEVISAMDGVCVAAQGDERMGEHFSTADDEVFKACTDSKEILQKICDGASIGTLCVSAGGWSVRLSRQFPRLVVDDSKVPCRDHYSVTVTLIAPDCFRDDAAIQEEYTRWLDPLEAPDRANRVSRTYGVTKDVSMGYRIRAPLLPAFMRRLGLGDRSEVEAYGEVQEKGQLTNFSVDLAHYGFRLQPEPQGPGR